MYIVLFFYCFCIIPRFYNAQSDDIEGSLVVAEIRNIYNELYKNGTLEYPKNSNFRNYIIGYDNEGRKAYVRADISEKNLFNGTDLTSEAKEYITTVGRFGDSAGYIIPKLLGGGGSIENVFPQNLQFQQEEFNEMTAMVANWTLSKSCFKGHTPYVIIFFRFYFDDHEYRQRPSRFVMFLKFLCKHQTPEFISIHVRSNKTCQVQNPAFYQGSKNRSLRFFWLFVSIETQMYYIKRSSYLENARKSGLSHHVIGYDQLLRTKMYVSAVITQKDLGKGKSPTNESRQWVKEVGVEGDQAGHIIAEQFGGSGDKENIFPQNPEFNMGCWRVIEETIKNHLTTNACGDCKIPSVRVEFGYYYANFFRYPRRPSSFIYHFRFMCHDPGSKEPIQINELKDDIMNPVEQEKNLKRPNKRPLEHDELRFK